MPQRDATYLLHALIGQPGASLLRLGQRTSGQCVQVEDRGAHLAALGSGCLSLSLQLLLLEQQGIGKIV